MMSKSIGTPNNSRRNFLLVIAAAVMLIGAHRAWLWYLTPPHLAASPDAKKTLDGLFTAFTAHDKDKLVTCMDRIEVHFAEGSLSEKGIVELRKCCELAKADLWEKAAERLYWIIFDQPQ